MASSLKIETYFDNYSTHHRNPVNKAIHWICVPMIMFSLLGLIWLVPYPYSLSFHGYLNWASFLIAFSVYYWFTLSPALSYAMIFVIALFAYLINVVNASFGHYAWAAYLIIFLAAWIGQFIGHKIEGKKPSFLQDLSYLLIGPLWLMHFIFQRIKLKY